MAISKFDLENPRSRSKFEVIKWVQHPISLLTHIPFIPCQSAIPFLRYGYFKIWPWKQGHIWRSYSGPNILSTQIPFIPCQPSLRLPFLRYGFLKIWPWKSKVKYMGEVKVQCHIVGPTSYGHTSLLLHVNQPAHFWYMAISKFDLENPRTRSQLKVI